MSIATSLGSGRVHAAELDLIFDSRIPAGGSRGVVWCHEHGANGFYLFGYYQFGHRLLAEAGTSVISTDLGGTTHWGNDTAQARIQEAWDWLVSNRGVDADKVILMSYSMGTLAALNWARANPTKVAAIACCLPANDLADFHTNDRGGFATEIETAYGGAAAYAAAEDDHNPAANAADYADIPIKLWYTTDDTLVIPQTVTDFAAASGAQTESLGTGGHVSTAMNARSQFTFLKPYLR